MIYLHLFCIIWIIILWASALRPTHIPLIPPQIPYLLLTAFAQFALLHLPSNTLHEGTLAPLLGIVSTLILGSSDPFRLDYLRNKPHYLTYANPLLFIWNVLCLIGLFLY